jgi:hypothetical protein
MKSRKITLSTPCVYPARCPQSRGPQRAPTHAHGHSERWAVPPLRMFPFFTNRFGCLGSLLVSAIVTILPLRGCTSHGRPVSLEIRSLVPHANGSGSA